MKEFFLLFYPPNCASTPTLLHLPPPPPSLYLAFPLGTLCFWMTETSPGHYIQGDRIVFLFSAWLQPVQVCSSFFLLSMDLYEGEK